MSDRLTPTDEEAKAIRALKRLAKKWPKSLWIFCNGINVYVMRYGPDGAPVITNGRDGGTDPAYVVDTVNIPSDGGDW